MQPIHLIRTIILLGAIPSSSAEDARSAATPGHVSAAPSGRPDRLRLVIAGPSAAVEDVEVDPFRQHVRRLRKALEVLRSSLPAETAKELDKLLGMRAIDAATIARIQELLDARCLCLVHINPESRVKAARGPQVAVLVRGRPEMVLVKVHNEAGVTHPLKVSGPQLRIANAKDGERWLEAAVQVDRPLAEKLSGQKVEYVVLRLLAHQVGKREATLRFDVGQGTQDLGFRAEVPILFTVKPAD